MKQSLTILTTLVLFLLSCTDECKSFTKVFPVDTNTKISIRNNNIETERGIVHWLTLINDGNELGLDSLNSLMLCPVNIEEVGTTPDMIVELEIDNKIFKFSYCLKKYNEIYLEDFNTNQIYQVKQ